MITALAPHKGPVFQADAHTVHGYLRGFISGQQASYWSADVIEKANGWSDILALRVHYGGSGNLTAIIAEAQRLYNTLSYWSEKSKGLFEKFLTETKRMFKMFADNGESMTPNQQVCFILDKNHVQAASLHSTIDTSLVCYQERAAQ
jgi:hypothetical protein